MSDSITFDKEEAAQLTEYMELVDSVMTKQAEEIQQLKQANEELTSQKEAADKDEDPQPVLNEEKIAETVGGLIEAGLAKEGEREDLVEHLKQPENCLGVIDKIAALRVKTAGTMPRMGKVAGNERAAATKQRESDTLFERQFN